VAIVAVAVVVATKVFGGGSYRLEVLLPTADGAIHGSAVTIGGQQVGTVSAVGVSGNAAKLTLQLSGNRVPLHAGTVARINWDSVIGRRQVELVPGPAGNPVLRSGQLIKSKVERVELDDVLDTLDGPTRTKVQQLVADLNTALQGNESDLQQTIQEAGPFVQALGTVLKGVGSDQPAIDTLVTRLHSLTHTLSANGSNTADTVKKLSAVVAETSKQEAALAAALGEVPDTLHDASTLFGHVPGAVDATVPLLQKLKPTTDQLPAVAKQLNPVLTQLRPTVADLGPTLDAVAPLLQETPGLLDVGTQTVPEVETALSTLQPAVSFLRPYTPEIAGFVENWASIFSGKNASGHFGRTLIPVSASMLDSNPGILPPGMTQWKEPLPGQTADQPWTDANGDAAR
jgi:phospholipid/cholesterol/gamma-HCH transport system substrate-binding protein